MSFELRHKLKIAVRILILTAAPCAGFSQPLFQPDADDLQRRIAAQQRLVERIQTVQSQNGVNSEDLIGPLSALSLLYQEGGDHALAIATIERALQAVRANYGLYSLDQAHLIQQRIDNEEARGDFAAAWDHEQKLLALVRRHPNDLRTVPIYRKIADKRMNLRKRYGAGEYLPQIILGCFYRLRNDRVGSCESGSKSVAMRRILSVAQFHYAEAIGVMLRNELYSSDELRELLEKLVTDSYRYGNVGLGRRSLRYLLAYEATNSDSWLTRIDTLVRLADWDLLHNDYGSALELYELAWERLMQQGAGRESIERFFSPTTPLVIPTFLPNPLASNETQGLTEYVDVAFEVSKFGRSRRINIVGATPNATDAAKDDLVRLIARSRFRPRVTGQKSSEKTPYVMRYYLTE